MELLFLVFFGYGAWWCGSKLIGRLRLLRVGAHHRELEAARAKAAADRQRAAVYAGDQKLRTQNHEMQSALLQLESAPDFQRAAWFASRAQDIPVDFRQRQFHRFRPRILQHLVVRLRGGTNSDQLRQSLVELVTQLSLATFEADYLWREAEQQINRQSIVSEPGFAAEMTSLEQEHQQRLSTLRSLTGIDDDLREQLLEAEEQRFREAMLALNDDTAQPPAEI